MKTDNSNVPKLRFPEFLEAGEWEEKNLKNICQMKAGKFASASEIKEKSGQYLYPCFGGNGLRGFTKTYTHDGIYPLIGRQGALCGNINITRGKFHATEHAIVTTPNNNIDVKWLFYELILLNLNQYATGQAQPGLSVENIEKIIARIPPKKAEQQKIAACLSSLDELISAHSKKLDALKKHKKGLMQQLFPAEGQTVPTLRFPEFREAGEWVEKKLGEMLLSHPDYGVNAPAVPYSEKLPTYIRITDISDDGHFCQDNKVSVAIDIKDENYLFDGDIVLARTGATVGKSYKYRKEDGKLVFAGFLIRIRPNNNELDSTFLFNFLSTQQYWNWVNITSTRSGQPGINGNEYSILPIPVPPRKKLELLEQQKIAACLSSLDELITAQSQKLAALKKHKKGLMQQLFPAAL